MIRTDLGKADFPSFRSPVRAQWAPVILAPISGSYEQFVIGVAVANSSEYYLEMANSLACLDCLYGSNAQAIVFAIELASKHLREDLALRSVKALTDPSSPISGITVGEVRDAEGDSVRGIGKSWMLSLSSLYKEQSEALIYDFEEAVFYASPMDYRIKDDLPSKVMQYVVGKNDSYRRYFRSDLHSRNGMRVRRRSHHVNIDFAGSRLVANFGTLNPKTISRSVGIIKTRLWDLKVERDSETHIALARRHEMLVQRPSPYDPAFSDRQHANVGEALESLEHQADQEELRLRVMSSVSEMGEQVLQSEFTRIG